MSPLESTPSTPFLVKIPPEIRLTVYKHFFRSCSVELDDFYLVDSQVKPRSSHQARDWTSLLKTCKTVNVEATKVFITETNFFIPDHWRPFDLQRQLSVVFRASNLIVPSPSSCLSEMVGKILVRREQRIQNLTIVARAHSSNGWAPLNDTINHCATHLRRVFDFSAQPVHLILKTIDTDAYPQYSPVRLGVYTQCQQRDGQCSKSLTLFGPLQSDIIEMFNILAKTQRQDFLAPRYPSIDEVDVKMTNCWPYKSLKVKVAYSDATRLPTLEW